MSETEGKQVMGYYNILRCANVRRMILERL